MKSEFGIEATGREDILRLLRKIKERINDKRRSNKKPS